jgi:hypothetical protein
LRALQAASPAAVFAQLSQLWVPVLQMGRAGSAVQSALVKHATQLNVAGLHWAVGALQPLSSDGSQPTQPCGVHWLGGGQLSGLAVQGSHSCCALQMGFSP